MKEKLKFFNSYTFYILIIYILFSLFILFYRLANFMPGISHIEQSIIQSTPSFRSLSDNAINLPINLLRITINKTVSNPTIFFDRLPSVVLGGLSILFFGLALKYWYGHRASLLGTIFYLTSFWVISTSRLATNDVQTLFGISLLFLIMALIKKKYSSKILYIVSNFVLGLLMFIPGLIWFIVLGLVIYRKEFIYGIKLQKPISLILYIIFSIGLIPLAIFNVFKNPQLIYKFIGFNFTHFNLINKLKDLGLAFWHLIFIGPNNPVYWLGKIPALNILSFVGLILGFYFLIIHIKSSQSIFLLLGLILSMIILGLNKNNSLSLGVPFIYLIVAIGITYLMQLWLKLFPVNPLARGLGVSLIIIAILFSCWFETRAYFIAFRYDPTNRASFDIKLQD